MQYVVWGILLLPVAALLWTRFVEPNWLSHERAEVPIRDLPPALDGFKISVLGDFHYPRSSSVALIRRAIELSNAADPDVVLLTGDLCDTARGKPKIVPPLGDLFTGIAHRYGIYGVLGNHDHWLGAETVRAEIRTSTPVRLIENESVLVDVDGRRLAIGGVGDLWLGVVDVDAAFAGVPNTVPRILLAHNPDVAEETTPGSVRIDLQISGHTHGGQICIPFGPALWLPSRYGNKYRAGLVPGPNHRVYINRGVGSTRNIRFACRPEITLITLRRDTSTNPPHDP